MTSGKKKNDMKNLMTSVPQDAVTQKQANQFEARPGPRYGSGVRATNPNCDTLPLVISVFQNERDNKPLRVDLTWSQMLGRYFKRHWINKTKVGGQAMSPVSYKPSYSRGNAGIDEVCCAVFDIEHHGSFDDLRARLDGYAFVAHSSYRHTTEDPRFRLILPLTKPVPASEWADTWERLNQWLGGINDPATKDAARLYYLPSQPPDAVGHFIVSGEGKAIDIGELPDLPTEQLAKISAPATRSHLKIKIDGIDDMPPDPLNPAEGLERVVAGCKFMAETSQPEGQKTASRPIWMAMVSNACRFEGSDGWIHEASCHHEGYDERVTDKLIQDCRDKFHGPITCKLIQEYGYRGCPKGGCKTGRGKVTGAPAGLWTSRDVTGEVAHVDGVPKRMAARPSDVIDFVRDNFPNGLLYIKEEFLGYEDGYWKRLDLSADVRFRVANYLAEAASIKKINNLTGLLQDFHATKEDYMKVLGSENLICMRNGTLDTASYELKSHSPEHGLVYKLDIDWSPEAQSPRWLQFLDEIFANDQDKAEKIQFVQEWFGYCLTSDTSQHKFVWMVGSGGNGKSVLLNVLTGLLGTVNVSHAQLERLDRPAVRAELDGKLVNISSEMSAEATLADGYLKAIVSGDVIEAERKFKSSFSFRPIVKLIGATNHLPRLLDLSDGFFRRAVILTFNRQFTEAEQDRGLEGRLNAEVAGIFAWAIAGLRRLRERGGFAIPPSSIAALNAYRVESDTVGMFSGECIEATQEGGMSSRDLFQGYSEWCRNFGFRAKNVVGFGKRLRELGFENFRMASGNGWRVQAKLGNAYLFDYRSMELAVQVR